MAIARIPTLLSLDQFSDILGMDPRHFNQIVSNDFPEVSQAGSVWYQWGWMLPMRAPREELARAIAQAESIIADFVGFWPAPNRIVGEIHRYPRQRMFGTNLQDIYSGAASTDRMKTQKLNWGYWIRGGQRRLELIEADVVVTYSNPDGDNFDELATLATINYTDGLNIDEISIFAGTDTVDEYRIRNLDIVYNEVTGDIDITGPSAYFVDPDLWERESAIDGDVPGNFLGTVNVYRIYTSDWGEDYAPMHFGWQRSSVIGIATSYGIQQLWYPEVGSVTPIPATWNATTEVWNRVYFRIGDEPHLARYNYEAGWSLDSRGRMRWPFDRAVAALAVSLLSKPICGASVGERLGDEWASETDQYIPFGNKRGAIEAYMLVAKFKSDVEGVSL